MADNNSLVEALMAVGFEVLSQQPSPTQLRLTGRVLPASVNRWYSVANSLLAAEEGAPWTLDLSKKYFRRDGYIIFAWRLIIQVPSGGNLPAALAQVEQVLRSQTVVAAVATSASPTAELEEIPLLGASRSNSAGGRGVSPVGKAPLILRRR